MADKRIPELLKIPARVRFLSVEPMLEAIDLTCVGPGARNGSGEFCCNPLLGEYPYYRESDGEPCVYYGAAIHWVIYGGESGKGARPCNVDWIRDGVKQCQAAGVAAFVKQIGRNPEWSDKDMAERWYESFSDPKGGDMAEWPADLRVRQFPITR